MKTKQVQKPKASTCISLGWDSLQLFGDKGCDIKVTGNCDHNIYATDTQISHNTCMNHWQIFARVCVEQQPYRSLVSLHYDDTPVQYTAIFHCCKKDNFQMKTCDIFLIFAQNIDCGYTLEPPQ